MESAACAPEGDALLPLKPTFANSRTRHLAACPMSSESVHNPPDIAELASLFFPRLEALGRFEPVAEESLPRA